MLERKKKRREKEEQKERKDKKMMKQKKKKRKRKKMTEFQFKLMLSSWNLIRSKFNSNFPRKFYHIFIKRFLKELTLVLMFLLNIFLG